MVSPFNVFPPSWGTGRRVYSLAVHLSRFRRVVLLCNGFPDPVDERSLDDALSLGGNLSIDIIKWNGRNSQLFNPVLLIETLKRLKSEQFAVLLGEFLWSASICIPASRISSVPFVLDSHNVESKRLSSVRDLKQPLGRILRSIETFSCRSAIKVMCVSEPDRRTFNEALNIGAGKLELIPHGAEFPERRDQEKVRTDVRKNLGLAANEPIVLFFGPADYAPNRQAADILCSVIAPRVLLRTPRARFVIVGRGWERARSGGSIQFVGYVPDIGEFIAAAEVVAVPLYRGGGAQLKVVESLASGTPVVTTPFVAERFASTIIERALMVGQNNMEMADQISSVLANPGLRFSVQDIRRELSWEAIASKVNDILNGLAC